jgi:hypothetical protein
MAATTPPVQYVAFLDSGVTMKPSTKKSPPELRDLDYTSILERRDEKHRTGNSRLAEWESYPPKRAVNWVRSGN